MLSDYKTLRSILYVTYIILTERQIRNVSCMAAVDKLPNALFTVYIQVCQSAVEQRNRTDCVIHVSLIYFSSHVIFFCNKYCNITQTQFCFLIWN